MIINFTPTEDFKKNNTKLFLFNIFPKLSFSSIDEKITYKNVETEDDLLLLGAVILYLLDLKANFPELDNVENTERNIALPAFLEEGIPLRLFEKKKKGLDKINFVKAKRNKKEFQEKKDEFSSLSLSFRKLNNLLLTANAQYYFSNKEFLFNNTLVRDYANFPDMISTDIQEEDGKPIYNYGDQEYRTPVVRYKDLILLLNGEWFKTLKNLDEEAIILLSFFDKDDIFFKLMEDTYLSTIDKKEHEFKGVEMIPGIVYTLLGTPNLKKDGRVNASKSKVEKMFKKVVIKTNSTIAGMPIHVVNNHQYKLYLDKVNADVLLKDEKKED